MAAGRPVLSPNVIGAVLAGGASSRFGTADKATVIGPRVVAAMRDARIDPVVAIGGTPGALGIPTIADRYPGEGPLGAIATATTYAPSGWVLAATCDLPLLAPSTVELLLSELGSVAPEIAVVAGIGGKPRPSLGCWPSSWAPSIHRAVRNGERRFRHLLEIGQVHTVDVPTESLEDADDPERLRQLLSGHAQQSGEPSAHDDAWRLP